MYSHSPCLNFSYLNFLCINNTFFQFSRMSIDMVGAEYGALMEITRTRPGFSSQQDEDDEPPRKRSDMIYTDGDTWTTEGSQPDRLLTSTHRR